MITVDWLLDTGNLAIIIQPKEYNLRDMGKTDFYTLSKKEEKARKEFEKIRSKIIKFLNEKDKNKA